jgi:hypothetical protein
MAGIDLKKTGIDPSANFGGNLIPSAGGGVSPVGLLGGDWLGMGLQVLGLFGGGSKVSQSSSISEGALNTSGWAIGEGSAEGADLTTSKSPVNFNELPWYVWAVGTLVIVAVIKKAV